VFLEGNEELAELETLDNGKPLLFSRIVDVPTARDVFRYMAGWATPAPGAGSRNLVAAPAYQNQS